MRLVLVAFVLVFGVALAQPPAGPGDAVRGGPPACGPGAPRLSLEGRMPISAAAWFSERLLASARAQQDPRAKTTSFPSEGGHVKPKFTSCGSANATSRVA